ncbi:MAG: M48 family metalloprotease [bacterium]
MTGGAKAALLTAVALLLVGLLLALTVVPWDAAVAPWAPLDFPDALEAVGSDAAAAIAAYAAAAWLPGLLGLIAAPAVAVLVLLTPALRSALARIGPAWPPLASAFVRCLVLLAVAQVAALPFDAWLASARRDHGLLIEPWWTWFGRWLGYASLVVVLGSVAVALALAAARRWPRGWWAGAVVAGFVVAGVASLAVPLTYQVEGTRSDPALQSRVQEIAARAGVAVDRVVVAETSDRSPVINATVSGLGPTRTVTVFDTLLPGPDAASDTTASAQVDALIAHELVHVRENDVLIGTLLAALGAAAIVALAAAVMMSSRVQGTLGAQGAGDPRMVPVPIAIVLVGSLLALPVGVSVSRAVEARADREAIALTGDAEAYADLMARLAATNKSTLEPPRWRYALLFTHPTPLQRIEAALPSQDPVP